VREGIVGTNTMGRRMRSAQKWLYPGLEVKRWLVLLLIAIIVLSLALTVSLYELRASGFISLSVWRTLTLSFVPSWARLVGIAVFGFGLAALAIYRLNHSLLAAFVPPGNTSVVDAVYRHRQRQRGPRVVVLGGGNGLSTLLRGLKAYTDHITAIVTVADDGGSSGRLRRELGVLPPGDFRSCIAALADDEALTTQLFQYRFPSRSVIVPGGDSSLSSQGDHAGAEVAVPSALDGHSFGNLFITAMANVTGSFEKALVESGRVLAVRGQILPSTLENVTLWAELVDETSVRRHVAGETAIPLARLPIERVYLEPADVPAYPPALRAILEADLIIAGPGSLFTSVLPNLLVDDIVRAIRASQAIKMYVCNVATQQGETDSFSVADHVAAIERHAGSRLFPFVLANSNVASRPPVAWNFAQVVVTEPPGAGYQVILADIVDEQRPWRHDPENLARELMTWYESATRPTSGN
jgi:uncharacterized cofD-like protein